MDLISIVGAKADLGRVDRIEKVALAIGQDP